jgi:uncharacterized SAM-binding protein YcdF (DUF218 family)
MPHASLAIVLGASTKDGKPTPVFQRRIETAIGLYQKNKVQKVLFTGGPGNPPQAIVAKQYAQNHGIPEEYILVETQSKNTLENLKFAMQLLPPAREQNVLIVSDSLHLMRAMFLANRLGLKAYPYPVQKTQYLSTATRIKFLLREISAYVYYRVLDGTGLIDFKK